MHTITPHTFFEKDRSIFSSHIFRAGWTDLPFLFNSSSRPHHHEASTSFMDHCFLGIYSIIICSSLLDQQISEALNWMFNSASDINNSIPALISATQFLLCLQQPSSNSDISNLSLSLTSAISSRL